MPWKFNPFSNTLDQTGSGGGGASYIDGEVQNFSALPETLGTPAVDSAYLVREAEGTWLLARKPAGIYIRTADTGVRAADWTHAGAFPDVFNDANFLLYDNGDSTRNLQFQLSGITTATTRTLTVPDASGTIARTEDFAAPPAIGNTTPAAGSFTTLTANGSGSADLVAEFGVAAAGRNHEIQIWGNAAGRNQVIRASAAAGIDFRMAAGGAHCGLSTAATPTGFRQSANSAFAWSSNASNTFSGSMDCAIFRDAADTVAQRRDANPQTFRLYNTYTDASNYERGFMRWSSNVLQIGAEKAGTGSARALALQTDGATRITVGENGNTTFGGGLALQWGGGGTRIIGATFPAALLQLQTGSTDRLTIDANGIIGFGGTTSSFPALKRSTTTLQARLADDTNFTALQGKLTTETAYTAGAPTATGYLVLYDSSGTAYKVSAEAL